MTLEILLNGQACNLACTYCYETGMRDAGNLGLGPIDLPAIKREIDRQGTHFTLFGGEPLLGDLAAIEELWAYGLEKHGQNNIQTNGALITERHLDLFDKYKVGVGISVDGPGELNRARWSGSLESTDAATARTFWAINALLERGRTPSLIITLHQLNARAERLERFKGWLSELDSMGIRYIRLHALEQDNGVGPVIGLSPTEERTAFVELWRYVRAKALRLEVAEFSDVLALLRGDDRNASCVWVGCDPLTTSAVQGISAAGELHNCGRTYKDGVDWAKAAGAGYERQLSLHHTPQAEGGCAGCRWFALCKGQCPGSGLNGDTRNRSTGCLSYKGLFAMGAEILESSGDTVIVDDDERRAFLEDGLVHGWTEGRNPRLYNLLNPGTTDPSHGDQRHGDHTDNTQPSHGDRPHGDGGHGDSGHGDRPHGDSGHGDNPHGDNRGLVVERVTRERRN